MTIHHEPIIIEPYAKAILTDYMKLIEKVRYETSACEPSFPLNIKEGILHELEMCEAACRKCDYVAASEHAGRCEEITKSSNCTRHVLYFGDEKYVDITHIPVKVSEMIHEFEQSMRLRLPKYGEGYDVSGAVERIFGSLLRENSKALSPCALRGAEMVFVDPFQKNMTDMKICVKVADLPKIYEQLKGIGEHESSINSAKNAVNAEPFIVEYAFNLPKRIAYEVKNYSMRVKKYVIDELETIVSRNALNDFYFRKFHSPEFMTPEIRDDLYVIRYLTGRLRDGIPRVINENEALRISKSHNFYHDLKTFDIKKQIDDE